MSLFNVVFRMLNHQGTGFAAPRLEDGHGSTADLPTNVADSGEREYSHVVATVTDIGDTVIHTPASGKRIRVRWIYAINDPTASSAPIISVKLGLEEKYRVYALSKRQLITGEVDAPLIINLNTTANVQVTAVLEEI